MTIYLSSEKKGSGEPLKPQKGINKMKVNAGYEIILERKFSTFSIVLGKAISEKTPTQWVTWEYTESEINPTICSYYWGHYHTEQIKALHDYIERICQYTNKPPFEI